MSNAEHECRQVDLEDTAPALYNALDKATTELIGERDVLYESVSAPGGSIPDPEDREGIAELDRVIDEGRAALAKARGEINDE